MEIQKLIGEKMNLKMFQKKFSLKCVHNIILFLIIIYFFIFAIFLSINLKPGMVPDELAHFQFAKQFSTTLGKPSDTYETYSLGWYIKDNPFLYHYINGRIINLSTLISPDIEGWRLLLILRLVNVIFATGSVMFCYLLSKEVIHNKWWQLLPVFLLTNTLMYVFLASGINYDNLVNLLCIAGIYFLIRVIKGYGFVANSLAWLICITFGSLVKYTVLPLALIMLLIWIGYILINLKLVFPLRRINTKNIIQIIILIPLVIGNLMVYGKNLIYYQSILPACRDILSDSQCEISPFEQRQRKEFREQKLTIMQSLDLDYPDPFEYAIMVWPRAMCSRTFGIAGYFGYSPQGITFMYYLVFLWIFLLIFKYWQKPAFSIVSLALLFVIYSFVLLIVNYNSDLSSGFKHYALQGRYIFPVIGAAYVFISRMVKDIPSKTFKWATLSVIILLFIVGGPINIILKYNTIFITWFK